MNPKMIDQSAPPIRPIDVDDTVTPEEIEFIKERLAQRERRSRPRAEFYAALKTKRPSPR